MKKIRSVRTPCGRQGRIAARMLVGALTASADPLVGSHVLVPTDLVLRRSTAAPPASRRLPR